MLGFLVLNGSLFVVLIAYAYFFVQWRSEIRSNPGAYVNHPGLHALLLNKLGGPAFRRTFLDGSPQSHLPEVWSESTFSWTRVVDDFWTTGIRPPLKDRSHLVVAESDLTPEQAIKLKDELISMSERLENLRWKNISRSRGVCDGTICAVHRWDAYTQESLVGRFQCWTDPSLLDLDPQFVKKNPLFHPTFVNATIFFCLIDVPGFAASLAARRNQTILHINDLIWLTETAFDHNVLVRDNDLPADVMRKGILPYFLQFLKAFVENGQNEESEDEGEIIDLDLLDNNPFPSGEL